jgi:hemerythrin superfamily protein
MRYAPDVPVSIYFVRRQIPSINSRMLESASDQVDLQAPVQTSVPTRDLQIYLPIAGPGRDSCLIVVVGLSYPRICRGMTPISSRAIKLMVQATSHEGICMNSDQTQQSPEAPKDAIDQLVADHQKVKGLFSQFENMKAGVSAEERGALVQKIRDELTVHETVENDVFFPAVREVLRSKDALQEATVEQEDAGDAIHALGELTPSEPGYEEKVNQLGSKIAAHAADEEKDVFPKVQGSKVDTEELGAKMAARKAELTADRDDAGR